MPPEAPLSLKVQDLSRPFRDPAAPPLPREPRLAARLFIFAGTPLIAGAFVWLLAAWLAAGGFTAAELVLCALVGFSNAVIAFHALTALVGLAPQRSVSPPGGSLDVALLLLTYNEAPEPVFARAAAMRDALATAPGGHRFRLYILSDTREAAIAAREEELFHRIAGAGPVPVHYRRREVNTDRKLGNLHDWLARHGGGHDAMLVLDADSLMTAGAITALADRMAADPGLGIAQTAPGLTPGATLFARLQSFGAAAFGAPLARGLNRWTGDTGNFWGHNALLRLPAFAQAAVLPRIGRKRTLILSHDFVEAALMRRAGWAVRFFPEIDGSTEAAPPTLVEWILRDRRWIAGNLQHLRLLRARGLSPLSRLHFLLGAGAYLISPAWLTVVAIWALHGSPAPDYFADENPLYPVWPVATAVGPLTVLALTAGLLLLPKLLALACVLPKADRFGGLPRLIASSLAEIACTALLAPILMVQVSRAALAVLIGRRPDWQAPNREGAGWSLPQLLRFHWIETLGGTALVAGTAAGLVSPWLLPIGASLTLSAGLSWLTQRPAPRLFASPDSLAPPEVAQAAAAWETSLRREPISALVAAE